MNSPEVVVSCHTRQPFCTPCILCPPWTILHPPSNICTRPRSQVARNKLLAVAVVVHIDHVPFAYRDLSPDLVPCDNREKMTSRVSMNRLLRQPVERDCIPSTAWDPRTWRGREEGKEMVILQK